MDRLLHEVSMTQMGLLTGTHSIANGPGTCGAHTFPFNKVECTFLNKYRATRSCCSFCWVK